MKEINMIIIGSDTIPASYQLLVANIEIYH